MSLGSQPDASFSIHFQLCLALHPFPQWLLLHSHKVPGHGSASEPQQEMGELRDGCGPAHMEMPAVSGITGWFCPKASAPLTA